MLEAQRACTPHGASAQPQSSILNFNERNHVGSSREKVSLHSIFQERSHETSVNGEEGGFSCSPGSTFQEPHHIQSLVAFVHNVLYVRCVQSVTLKSNSQMLVFLFKGMGTVVSANCTDGGLRFVVNRTAADFDGENRKPEFMHHVATLDSES